jgi:pimeloyl-ACP methyl ester carboxylesterase
VTDLGGVTSRPWLALALLAGVLLVGMSPAATIGVRLTAGHAPMPAACGRDGSRCRQELIGANGTGAPWRLQTYQNVPMSGSTSVTQAVVVIHGTGGNAAGYFASMMNAATRAGVVGNTAVIAPWFKTGKNKPAHGEAVWTNDSWKDGGGAVRPAGLSSFTVLDQILATLADRSRFPDLRRITVAGHSAGGQFTQRYAAFGLAPGRLAGVAVNFVVANPSSFVYFSPVRPAAGGGFAVPLPGSCPGYDDYKYGMGHRSGYPAGPTPAQAAQTYVTRRVTLLSGGADVNDNGDEDTSCAAKAQGPDRNARAADYVNYIRAIAPGAAQDRIVVPGVGHDGDAMFASPLAWPALFHTPAQAPAP